MKSKVIVGAIAIAVLACFAFISIDKSERTNADQNKIAKTEKLSGVTLEDNKF